MFRFVFGIHCHQPVGNFDEVIDDAVTDAYRPFLDEIGRHENLRMTIHVSGCLIQMLEKRAPDLIETLGELARGGRVELLGGGFYEPIFPVIPEADLIGQIEYMAQRIEKIGGRRPRGAWLPERVWEPSLPEPLSQAGVEYLPVDDEHFRAAGFKNSELTNRFVVTSGGKAVSLFPIDERLRYVIPFHSVPEVIDELKKRAAANPDGVVVMADDGEKFGVWPSTKERCWTKKWVSKFFEALEKESDWLETSTFEDVVDSTEPAGYASIPAASYFEMGEWALPVEASRDFSKFVRGLKKRNEWEEVRPFVRGGTWRGFLQKYPETRHRLARIHDLSARLRPYPSRKPDEALIEVPPERESLWRAQCNCAYWHGVFGGIYLPFLRAALNAAMIRAEHRHDRVDGPHVSGAQIRIVDLDADGNLEACLSNGRLSLWLRSNEGGLVEEMDDRLRLLDYADVLSRRPEAYHGSDVTAAGGEDEAAEAATIHDMPVVTEVPDYDPFRRKPLRVRLVHAPEEDEDLTVSRTDDPLALGLGRSMFEKTAAGELRIVSTPADGGWRLVRTLALRTEGIDVRVELESESELPQGSVLVVEWPVSIWEKDGEIVYGKDRKIDISKNRTVESVRALTIRNRSNGAALRFGFTKPVRVSHDPIRTVSLSEKGGEQIYQGALLVFGVAARARRASMEFTIDVA